MSGWTAASASQMQMGIWPEKVQVGGGEDGVGCLSRRRGLLDRGCRTNESAGRKNVRISFIEVMMPISDDMPLFTNDMIADIAADDLFLVTAIARC
ncbi:hypothetical protein M5K25_017049 [Dendrobium thyrsiflorum]|uniref:Uncharacterized protein n=1 Tax=Dendrobium thyrsiflorum TaxID=117978 RepID=A0ABD0ULE1_DENTH